MLDLYQEKPQLLIEVYEHGDHGKVPTKLPTDFVELALKYAQQYKEWYMHEEMKPFCDLGGDKTCCMILWELVKHMLAWREPQWVLWLFAQIGMPRPLSSYPEKQS
jgi:hypothetical protein